jgi:histidinol-phosphate/aromatic aminotransferase/cobyric acid decarboxylase-like protein
MVQAFIEGYRIQCIGGMVLQLNTCLPEHGKFLMGNVEARDCRDYLEKQGILMRRIDSGGTPEWEFRVAS